MAQEVITRELTKLGEGVRKVFNCGTEVVSEV